MKNTFGNQISVTLYGESHGAAVGAVLDGMPAGIPVDSAFLAACMDRRRARGDGLSTPRTEADEICFLSGVYEGHTTGTPITIEILNADTRSGDYAKTAALLRPGHADYTAYAKYNGFQDARGGGHFSGRITAGLVAAGAICLSALETCGVRIGTHLYRCAGVSDTPFTSELSADAVDCAAPCAAAALEAQLDTLAQCTGFAVIDSAAEQPMKEAILAAGSDGDSVGGILETAIAGLPAGLGEPFFDSVESSLAHIAFSIPAIKGIEFGAGFAFADLTGSTANDAFRIDPQSDLIYTETNRNGGINGGITNGMPVVFRTVIKPTPSIYKTQDTVDYTHKTNAELQIKGRHDPCIVPRAAIVQSCAAALVTADLLAGRYGDAWPAQRFTQGVTAENLAREKECR